MLLREEIVRYGRQILLPELGFAGQEKLKQTKVLVIGAGGLGCPVLLYLASMGVGTIGVVDSDKVEVSNLHRQVLYDDMDIGKLKATVAAQKLKQHNPLIQIDTFPLKLANANAMEIISQYDIIIDGTDNFTTRYLVNDACFLLHKVLLSGSIYKFEGQVTAFNFNSETSPTYRCLYPTPPAGMAALGCSETGVIGILPGIIGNFIVNEAVKIIAGIGDVLFGKVLLVNLLNLNFQTFSYNRNEEAINSIPKNAAEFVQMDYDDFCSK